MTRRRDPIIVPGGRILYDFRVGDRVVVPISGRTGEIVKYLGRHNGWRVRWDEPVMGVVEGRVATCNLAPLSEDEERSSTLGC